MTTASNDPGLLEALLDSWDRNQRILVNLLRAVPAEALSLRAIDGGPSVAELFTHIHSVRLAFVEEDAPECARPMPPKEWDDERDPDRIAAMLEESAVAVRDAVRGRLASGRAMDLHYDHPILMLQHLIWHEGYHHGQVKLALKLAGRGLADRDVGRGTWGVWMLKTGVAVLAAAFLAAPASAQTAAAAPSPWDPMRFFVGSWTGTGDGQPGQSTVERDFRWTLNGRFLEVSNRSTYAPQARNPKGEVHEDRGLLSWDRRRRRFLLRQFHVEGFVIQYVADSLVAGVDSVVFRSEAIENIPPGFRARETWRRLGPDEHVERFEMAEPDRDFALYSETRLRRAK